MYREVNIMNNKNTLTRIVFFTFLVVIVCANIPMVLGALSVQTDKSNYETGQTITVTVSGGTADGIVVIQFDYSGSPIWADQGSFSSTGGFSYSLKIPSSWSNGNYIVYVKDSTADTYVSKTFTIGVSPPPQPPPPRPPPPAENVAPVARAAGAKRAFTDRLIHFNGLGSTDKDGTITLYLWVFGDGTSEVGGQVTHSFTEAGNYLVNLTVVDDDGAPDKDTLNVTVRDPPIPPKWGLDKGVGPGEKNFLVNATIGANTTLTLNTTNQVTVCILTYPENPFPDVPLPPKSLEVIIDVDLTDPDAVEWPIYVERSYTDEEIEGMMESKLGIYYYKEGAWHKCRKTGVKPGQNLVWAWMYQDELWGSPTLIGELPTPANFEVSDLSISPSQVEPGEEIVISVNVTNVGEESGSYTVTVIINEEVEATREVTLSGLSSTVLTFTTVKEIEDIYTVEVDGLTGSFAVAIPPTEPEFRFSNLRISPTEVEPGEDLTVQVEVFNIGETSGSYTVKILLDGVIIDSKTITLDGQSTSTISFTISSQVQGDHTVEIEGLTGSFEVIPGPTPAEFEFSHVALFPKTVEPGEVVTINLQIENIGETRGLYEFVILLDSEIYDTLTGSLDGGRIEIVSIEVSSEDSGTHIVEVDGQEYTFTVESARKPFPWHIVVIIIVITSIIVVYYLNRTGTLTFARAVGGPSPTNLSYERGN